MPTRSIKIHLTCANVGNKAVVFRQGPSKWTRMFLWDTHSDNLTAGQWINSKIPSYGINSDASLVLSFVQSYRHDHSPWVALSKPPWFTALAVWHIGDSWGGNCAFVTDSDLYIGRGMNDVIFKGELKAGMRWSSDQPKEIKVPSDVEIIRVGNDVTFVKKSNITNFEFRHSFLSGKQKRSAYQYEGGVSHEINLPDDIYMLEMDSQGRIVYTRPNGIIYRISRSLQGLSTEEVFNLSDMNPEPIIAPNNAIKW